MSKAWFQLLESRFSGVILSWIYINSRILFQLCDYFLYFKIVIDMLNRPIYPITILTTQISVYILTKSMQLNIFHCLLTYSHASHFALFMTYLNMRSHVGINYWHKCSFSFWFIMKRKLSIYLWNLIELIEKRKELGINCLLPLCSVYVFWCFSLFSNNNPFELKIHNFEKIQHYWWYISWW
jgi:hypothetical protein